MRIKKILPLSLLLATLLTPHCRAQQGGVQLYGNEPDYAGITLEFKQKIDYISDADYTLATAQVNANGDFEVTLGIVEETLVTLELGVHNCLLFIEPGQTLRIGFPPRMDQSEAERLNPFFEHVEVRLRPYDEDPNSINAQISKFDKLLGDQLDHVMGQVQKLDPEPQIADGRRVLDSFPTENAHPYVQAYKTYRLGLYDYITGTLRSKMLSDTYFKNKPVLHNHPAYMELFNLVYDKYFVYHGRTPEGQKIFDAISEQRSYRALCDVLAQNDYLGQDTLRELVILKGIHDEFFSSNFSRKALTVILDTLYTQTKIPEHSIIATQIRERVTKLLPGFIPYPFTLTNQHEEKISLSQLRGKHLLLGFCTTSSYTCIQDFALLKRLEETYGTHLHIATVCADESFEAMAHYAKTAGYTWPFLFYGDRPQLIKEYDIRAYPTYFLLDEEGRIVLSPAPSPQENLDKLLHDILRAKGWTPKTPAKQQGRPPQNPRHRPPAGF